MWVLHFWCENSNYPGKSGIEKWSKILFHNFQLFLKNWIFGDNLRFSNSVITQKKKDKTVSRLECAKNNDLFSNIVVRRIPWEWVHKNTCKTEASWALPSISYPRVISKDSLSAFSQIWNWSAINRVENPWEVCWPEYSRDLEYLTVFSKYFD